MCRIDLMNLAGFCRMIAQTETTPEKVEKFKAARYSEETPKAKWP